MWSLGFRSITFVPTFVVREPFEIGLDYTPPLATIRAVLMHALTLGMDVKLEPHIDWQSTLDSTGEWRGLMRFDPCGAYSDRVIGPLRDLAIEAKGTYPERRVSLTLGSEVDRSVREFPDSWMELRIKAAAAGVDVGHKLNHDAPSALFRTRYLANLDYVSFSFYPTLNFVRPLEWWVAPPTSEQLETLANAFESRAAALERKLPLGPEFQIGEFGLGSADVVYPYKLDQQFFHDMDAGSRELRRKYYAGFLLSVPRLAKVGSVTFWSAGYFDFLGVFADQYKDETLISLVEAYNY